MDYSRLLFTQRALNDLANIVGYVVEDDDEAASRFGAEMAAAIQALIDDPPSRRAFEKRAREKVQRDYDWDAIAERQKRLYEELLQAQPRNMGHR